MKKMKLNSKIFFLKIIFTKIYLTSKLMVRSSIVVPFWKPHNVSSNIGIVLIRHVTRKIRQNDWHYLKSFYYLKEILESMYTNFVLNTTKKFAKMIDTIKEIVENDENEIEFKDFFS